MKESIGDSMQKERVEKKRFWGKINFDFLERDGEVQGVGAGLYTNVIFKNVKL